MWHDSSPSEDTTTATGNGLSSSGGEKASFIPESAYIACRFCLCKRPFPLVKAASETVLDRVRLSMALSRVFASLGLANSLGTSVTFPRSTWILRALRKLSEDDIDELRVGVSRDDVPARSSSVLKVRLGLEEFSFQGNVRVWSK